MLITLDGEPFCVVRYRVIGQRAQCSLRIKGDAHAVILRTSGDLKTIGLKPCNDRLDKVRLSGLYKLLRAKSKPFRELPIAGIAKAIGQRIRACGALFQNFADKEPIVDIILQAIGPQSDGQQLTVLDQILCRSNGADVLTEVIRVAL